MIEFRFDVFNIRLTHKKKVLSRRTYVGWEGEPNGCTVPLWSRDSFWDRERDPIGYYNFFLVMSLHANKFAEREEKKRGGGGVT